METIKTPDLCNNLLKSSKSYSLVVPLRVVATGRGCFFSFTVLGCGLRVVLCEHGSVLRKQSLLLLLDDVGLLLFVCLLGCAFLDLYRTLFLVNCELLLPQALDLASVLQLAHPSLLLSHLFEALVLGKLSHQLLLEVLLETFLFSCSLSFQTHLEVFGFLEFATGLIFLVLSLLLALASCNLALLHVQLIAQVLTELGLSSSLHLLLL